MKLNPLGPSPPTRHPVPACSAPGPTLYSLPLSLCLSPTLNEPSIQGILVAVLVACGMAGQLPREAVPFLAPTVSWRPGPSSPSLCLAFALPTPETGAPQGLPLVLFSSPLALSLEVSFLPPAPTPSLHSNDPSSLHPHPCSPSSRPKGVSVPMILKLSMSKLDPQAQHGYLKLSMSKLELVIFPPFFDPSWAPHWEWP